MKKQWWITAWLNKGQQEDKVARLRCRCGLHKYKWDWRRLGYVCVYCKKRKGE